MRQVCFYCAEQLREAGQCVGVRLGRPGCSRASFCPHHRRCFVCDGADGWAGCAECRLLRGDGADVVALVQSVQADAVFLDFDRTLATTKRGASPLANPSRSKASTGKGKASSLDRGALVAKHEREGNGSDRWAAAAGASSRLNAKGCALHADEEAPHPRCHRSQ